MYLTLKEHFIAHLLLANIYSVRGLNFALYSMSNSKRYGKLSSRLYEKIRDEHLEKQRGIPCSKEHKEKIKKTMTGVKHTKERCERLKASWTPERKLKAKQTVRKRITNKKPHSEETKRKIKHTKSLQDLTYSEEAREKMRASWVKRREKGFVPWNKGLKLHKDINNLMNSNSYMR